MGGEFCLGLSSLILTVHYSKSVLRVKSKLRLSCKWEVFDLRMYKLHINDCHELPI